MRHKEPFLEESGLLCVAYTRIPVPSVHRIDRLREIRTAALVDAACINPHPIVPILHGLRAGELDLPPCRLPFRRRQRRPRPARRLEVREENLMVSVAIPCMTENSVTGRRDLIR